MLDASNTKLSAELQIVNARLDIIYNYYKMKRETGMLPAKAQ
jgi:outer membrane protein TolC